MSSIITLNSTKKENQNRNIKSFNLKPIWIKYALVAIVTLLLLSSGKILAGFGVLIVGIAGLFIQRIISEIPSIEILDKNFECTYEEIMEDLNNGY